MGVSVGQSDEMEMLQMSNNGQFPFFVDWISCVLPQRDFFVHGNTRLLLGDIQRHIDLIGLGDYWVACKPRFGYSLALRGETDGVVVQWSEDRPEMGVNVILTGTVCQKVGWLRALTALATANGRFTRVDLTIEALAPWLDLGTLSSSLRQGTAITRAKKWSLVTGGTGATLYVGSRSSEKMLRIYDKGAERGGVSGLLYRIELECKSDAANFVAYALVQPGEFPVREAIVGFCDFPCDDAWTRIMEGLEFTMNIPSEKRRPDTEAWLMGLVLDQMVKAEERRPGFLDTFYDEVVSRL
jgi:phage replication initiation protein